MGHHQEIREGRKKSLEKHKNACNYRNSNAQSFTYITVIHVTEVEQKYMYIFIERLLSYYTSSSSLSACCYPLLDEGLLHTAPFFTISCDVVPVVSMGLHLTRIYSYKTYHFDKRGQHLRN